MLKPAEAADKGTFLCTATKLLPANQWGEGRMGCSELVQLHIWLPAKAVVCHACLPTGAAWIGKCPCSLKRAGAWLAACQPAGPMPLLDAQSRVGRGNTKAFNNLNVPLLPESGARQHLMRDCFVTKSSTSSGLVSSLT